MLMLLNARQREVAFTLPGDDVRTLWRLDLDTARSTPEIRRHPSKQTYRLLPRSMVVFRQKSRRWSFFSLRHDQASPVILKPHVKADPTKEREPLIQRPTLVTEK
jgi:hypothetical protein